jgi:glyoxylase-like metal-dependent hydrolase (beta-lactamase superfamily II)
MLLGRGATTWLGEYPGCVGDYLTSLETLRSLSPEVIFPSHGPAIRDAEKTIQRFREHRMERLDQLRVARSGAPGATVEALARAVYGRDLPARLVKAAGSSIEVMLHHLDSLGHEA